MQAIAYNWVCFLPLTLLGIRTALKDDLKCSATELVYGTMLRLPGEFFDSPPSTNNSDPTAYATKLRESMQLLHATPTRLLKQGQVHVDKVLSSCTHVFVCCDAVRTPLQPPYDGPYKVLQRQGKSYVRAGSVLSQWTASSLLSAHMKVAALSCHQMVTRLNPNCSPSVSSPLPITFHSSLNTYHSFR